MKCLTCKKEFKAKRSDSKYCSANCRKLAFRNSGTDKLERLNGTANGTANIPDKYKTICTECNKPHIEHGQCFITINDKPIRTSIPYHCWAIDLSNQKATQHY